MGILFKSQLIWLLGLVFLCTSEASLPSAGFLKAKSGLGSLTVRILSKQLPIGTGSQSIPFCRYLTFVNQPPPNNSPLVGPNLFSIVNAKSESGHFIWSNGNESIFFVPYGKGSSGNWLLGFEVGVDNGYVFLESDDDTLSPLEILPNKSWRWLIDGKWVEQPEMRMECVKEASHYQILAKQVTAESETSASDREIPLPGETLAFYETPYYWIAEFFHPSEKSAVTAFLFANFSVDEFESFKKIPIASTDFDLNGLLAEARPHSPPEGQVTYGLLNPETLEFISLEEVEVWMLFGALHTIDSYVNDHYTLNHAFSDSLPPEMELTSASRPHLRPSRDNPFKLQQSEQAILLNVEHGDQTFRLTYRVVNQYLPKRNSSIFNRAPHKAITVPAKAFADIHPASKEFFQTYMQGFGGEDHPINNPDAMEGLPILPPDAFYYDYYFPGKWSKVRDHTKINRVLALKEYRVELSNAGVAKINDEAVDRYFLKNKYVYEIYPTQSLSPVPENIFSAHTETGEATATAQNDEDSHAVESSVSLSGEVAEISSDSSSSSTVTETKRVGEDWEAWQRFYREEFLSDIEVGDYLWLWYTTNSSSETVEELFVKLIYNHADNYFLFEVYPTHRLDQMRQNALDKIVDVLMIQRRNETFSAPSSSGLSLSAKLNRKEITIHSMIAIPRPHILRFLVSYLLLKEKVLNDLSSCFFYHAAVTIPQSLIYAAEILCVAIGSKPIAMIQYTTPSEHQWKFPLVQELSQAMLSLQTLREEVVQLASPLSPMDRLLKSLTIQSTTFTYERDQTLVFYHRDAQPLLRVLLPVNQTQALHPLPYELPETAAEADKLRVWKEQVFNAAWNGFALGYPSYFVLRYCEDFHNPLELSEKRRLYDKASKRFQKFIKKSSFFEPTKHFRIVERPEIQYGFHTPMNKYLLAMLNHRVVQSL